MLENTKKLTSVVINEQIILQRRTETSLLPPCPFVRDWDHRTFPLDFTKA